MIARSVGVVSPVAIAFLLFTLPNLSWGQERGEGQRWEYRSVSIEKNEIASTKQLNELALDGWEYVGPLAHGLVAFKRPHVSVPLSPKQVRRIEWADNHIFHTAFSPDGQFYLGGGDTGTLRIWEVATGRQVQELPVTFGLITPDGKQVVAHKGEKTVYFFDLATGKEVRTFNTTEPIVSLAIAPDGKQLACSHTDLTIRVWEAATGKEVCKLEGHKEIASVVFSPTGKQLLSASSADKTVRLWNVGTAKEILSFDEFKDATPLDGHDLIIQAMFAGDGQIASYVWGKEKYLVLWDVATGKKLRRLDLGDDHHKDLAVSRDGRWVLTGHDDRTVRLRELRTGKELHRFDMTDINVPRALSFSPDGRHAVAGSHRSWVYLWELKK